MWNLSKTVRDIKKQLFDIKRLKAGVGGSEGDSEKISKYWGHKETKREKDLSLQENAELHSFL